VLLLIGIFLGLLGGPVPAVPNTPAVQQANSISGHVADDARQALPNMQVELLNDMESVLQRTKTDTSGFFVFHRLTTGIFQIRVQTYGTSYVGQTKRVQLERTRAFEQVDFFLTKQSASVTGAGGAVFVQEVPESARKQFERATSLLERDDQREEGLEALKKAIGVFPQYFEALELLGTEYVKQREYEPAIPVLTKAVEVNRRSYPSVYALSVAYYNLKQLPEAIDSSRRAVALHPKSSAANLLLGMLLRQTGKLDEAETYLKDADHLSDSKSPDAHWQLALLYNQLKKYKDAADHLEVFLKIQPDSKDSELIKKLIKRFRDQSSGGN
jgi:tetratricopeptide (TPR) repeat protein